MGQNSIVIKGAREHNLKNVDLEIPRDKLVVITGLSGSGKSSLAFDTMYAEGQRRYVESLSSYARMFLGQMSKPDLDSIDGLSPAVSIDQKTTSRNPRSTVGTTTEIYDYLRLLFARVGIPHCPECGRVIKKQTTDQVTDDILALAADESTRAIIMAPVVTGRKGEFTKLFADLAKEGFSRVRIDGEIVKLTGEPITLNKKIKHFIDVVVDRVVLKKSATTRIAESVENATKLAEGRVLVQVLGPDGKPQGEAGGTSSGATGGLGEGERRARFELREGGLGSTRVRAVRLGAPPGRHRGICGDLDRCQRGALLARARLSRTWSFHGRASAARLLLQRTVRRLPRLPRHR